MKKVLLLAAALIGALLASPASAQWYVGGGLGAGRARLSASAITVGPGVTVTPQDSNGYNTTGKIFGGYQLTQYWGFEGQYVLLGKTNFNASSNGWIVQSYSKGKGSFGLIPAAVNSNTAFRYSVNINSSGSSKYVGSSLG